LLAVRLLGQITDGIFQGGLAGSVLFNPQAHTDPLKIAVGFAVLLLPYSAVGPFVGVFLDRWSRRTVVFWANLLRAIVVAPATVLTWYGHQTLPFAICALVIIGLGRFFQSGLNAATPHVVRSGQLVTANAVSGTVGTLTYSLGLGLAGLAVSTVLDRTFHGYAVLAGAALIGYLLAALLTRAWFSRAELGPDWAQRPAMRVGAALIDVARGLANGIRHLAQRPRAAGLLAVQCAHRILYGVLALATLLVYRRYFYPNDTRAAVVGLGAVVVAGGFGGLLAAVLTPPVTRRIGGQRWVAILLGSTGLIVLGLGLPFRPELLVTATFGLNVAAAGTKIVVDTSLQRDCDDQYRGRVFSVNDTTYNVTFVLGLLAGAWVLPPDGHSGVALAVVASGYLGLAAAFALLISRMPARARPA
jgi:MFS family permease